MLNFRCIGKRFCLSGGWQNVAKDAQFLVDNNVFAVLDLQFTSEDSDFARAAVTEALEKNLIEYKSIKMYDSEYNRDFEAILQEAFETLSLWESALDIAEKDKALLVEKPTLGGLGISAPKILVKCGAGNSRSVCVLIAYLCMSKRWTFEYAKNWLEESEDNWAQVTTPNFFSRIRMEPYFTYMLRKMFPETKSVFGEKE